MISFGFVTFHVVPKLLGVLFGFVAVFDIKSIIINIIAHPFIGAKYASGGDKPIVLSNLWFPPQFNSLATFEVVMIPAFFELGLKFFGGDFFD